MKLLKKKEVCSRVSYSPAHVDRLEAQGLFPNRVRLGQQRVAWVETEIDDWILSRIAERDSSEK